MTGRGRTVSQIDRDLDDLAGAVGELAAFTADLVAVDYGRDNPRRARALRLQEVAQGIADRLPHDDADGERPPDSEGEQGPAGEDVGDEQPETPEHGTSVPGDGGPVALVDVFDDQPGIMLAEGEVGTLHDALLHLVVRPNRSADADELFDRLAPLWATIDP